MSIGYSSQTSCRRSGMTIIEALISILIATMAIIAILFGYAGSSNRVEWSVYSLAAQSLAMQGLEQARAASWEPDQNKDELIAANFPATNLVLDVPFSGTNQVWATNFTTIGYVSTAPPLKWVRVDCVWAFRDYSTHRFRIFTNTALTYRRPNS